MEVTRTNFQEVLTQLDGILKDATFLGIDGEFTGLNSGPDTSAFDTPAQYYAKLRSGSMDFLLVQFGLSVFTYDNQSKKYNQQSYNFYVFPQPLNRQAPDCRFMCQASSITFLANQGFDFNKLFKLGIPYLTSEEEEKLIKRTEDRQRAREEGLDTIPISDEDKPQIDEICSRIDEFITSEAEELMIDRCNAFIRRLVHQEARVRWPNKIRLESKTENGGQCLVVQKIRTKEEEEKKEVERREKEKWDIKQAVGLTALLRMIADSGKLIVGHNMLLDLCHIVHQFFAPLPESYSEFKSLIHGLFPRILDTKVICQSPQFKDTVPSSNLNILLETVSKAPFSIPEVNCMENQSYSESVVKCHEAGYDAYITGLCFIALSNHLGSLQKPEISTVLSDSPLLEPFLNKLLIARLKDFPYINLTGKDPNPSRDHVFHITFPKEWKLSDLMQLFSPFGGVYVSFLSDTTAYVSLSRRDQATSVVKHLCKRGNFRIQKYAEHQSSLDTSNSSPTHGERKRKLSSSKSATSKDAKPEANGANSPGDDGWEVASGNKLKLSANISEQIDLPNSSSSPKDHSTFSKLRIDPEDPTSSLNDDQGIEGDVIFEKIRENVKAKQIKLVQKVRLKNTLSLPASFRNGGTAKKEMPKYTILRRNPEQLLEIGTADTLNPLISRMDEDLKKLKVTEKIGDADNNCSSRSFKASTIDSDDTIKHEKVFEVRKESLSRSKSNPIYGEKLKSVHQRLKCLEVSSISPKKLGRVACITPPTSPKVKRSSPKKHSKNKSVDSLSGLCNASAIEKPDKSEKLGFPADKQQLTRDEPTPRRKPNVEEKVELKRPTMKLLRSARKRSDNVLLTGSVLFRGVQIIGVLLLLFYVIVAF